MASTARVGRKSIVSIGAVSGSTFSTSLVPIEQVYKAGFTGGSWGTVDVSSFDSGVDEEFITTMRDNGGADLDFYEGDSLPGQLALEAAYDSGFKYDFKIQLPALPGQTTGKAYTFSALVESAFNLPIEIKSAVSNSAKLKISGQINRIPAVLSGS